MGQPSLLPAEPVLPQSTHDLSCNIPVLPSPFCPRTAKSYGLLSTGGFFFQVCIADTGGLTHVGWFCPSLLDVAIAFVCMCVCVCAHKMLHTRELDTHTHT